MHSIFRRALAVGLLFSSCLTCAACRTDHTADAGSPGADLIVDGTPVLYVDEAQKQTWEEPIARLLANVEIPYGEGGEILGVAPLDPDSPSVPLNYGCGLLDINLDGTPELLVHPDGCFGSSGCATYFAYDIHTGRRVGVIDDGVGTDTWCLYYSTEEKAFRLVGQYWLRGGWAARDRYLSFLEYDSESEEFLNSVYLHTFHAIDLERDELGDPDSTDDVDIIVVEEIYSDMAYMINGEKSYLDEYYDAYDRFVASHIRIPETALQLIGWDDVSEDEDSYEEKAKKMAKALVSTDQAFLIYPKTHKGGGL